MRITMVATALALIALPATAQRLDTTRIDTSGSQTSCVFRAIPELALSYDGDPTRSATWQQEAPGPNPRENARLSVYFLAHLDAPGGVIASASGVYVTENSGVLERAARAQFLVDGTDIGLPITADPQIEPSPDDEDGSIVVTSRPRGGYIPRAWVPASWSFTIRDGLTAGPRILNGRSVEFRLFDKDGEMIARYRWNVRPLRNAPAMLKQVGWSCTTPDR